MPKVTDRSIDFMDFVTGPFVGNAAIEEYLLSSQSLYNDLRDEASVLNVLQFPDRCPSKFLPTLAASIGFPLLDKPFATTREQRNLLKWAYWIFERQGTLHAVDKIIKILGFDPVTYKEVISEPFRLNGTPLYDPSQKIALQCGDDFDDSDVSDWEPQNAGSSWSVVNQRYVGEGNGNNHTSNCSLQDQVYQTSAGNWCTSVELEVLGGSGSHYPNFGIMLHWENPGNYILVSLITDAGTDYLRVIADHPDIPETKTPHILANVELPDDDYKLGVHTLRVWNRELNLTVCLDDRTIVTNVAYPHALTADTRMGLFANESTKAAFDNFSVIKLNIIDRGLLYSDKEITRQLHVSLYGDPSQRAAKVAYLQRILPEFVPFGVEVIVETIEP